MEVYKEDAQDSSLCYLNARIVIYIYFLGDTWKMNQTAKTKASHRHLSFGITVKKSED